MAMPSDVSVDHRPDPLLRAVALPYEHVYHPYGFPLHVRTNDQRILNAAAQSWGCFPPISVGKPLHLEVLVNTAPADTTMVPAPVCRSRGHLLTVTGDREHFAICDFEAGLACCWLASASLGDVAGIRYFYLDAVAYSLVAERYLTCVHAACVGRNGRGILLCGGSTAGKSTLAYAAARAGFTYTSDDGSFLLRHEPGRLVIGNSHLIRLRPPAVQLFPELQGRVPSLRPNGKFTMEMHTGELGFAAVAARTSADLLIFLNRQPSTVAPRLTPFRKDKARRLLEESIHYGRDRSLQEQRESLDRLLEVPVFLFEYSDLSPAVERLRVLIESGS